ncbi:TIGR03118 family protein [Undibacterium sp. 5I1]|uniref:TIGR03118 family protein n=1 Tax=unclassified Undibacterium TaxID=2630295 RepID=UPI002AB3E14D|nr:MULTISPECIES: TIGR03118 family protein [unclassified Undibacterium]MDY7538822.1 TIGR03118 family protein [Undibacterium sp. 5I1]MEB0231835.1 TIGR03118 family protein [Undibacterium sp. 10I3]MEB0258921.1 TIGR03118 family protein [Undibacterium sp. 5I1]
MQRRAFLKTSAIVSSSLWLSGCGGGGSGETVSVANSYKQTNLVANSAKYAPQIVEPELVDAWGLAIRPAGAGGHFWVTGMGNSFEYLGDVGGKPLMTDSLKKVALPASGENGGAGNGVVFNGGNNFVITQDHPNGAITGPAKFIFVSDNGVLSAWTERKLADGSFDRSGDALSMVDYGDQGSSFFGLAINPAEDQLFVVDFGANPTPTIRIFNTSFQEEALGGRFANPFIATSGFKVGDLVPFNIQTVTYAGKTSVFIAYVNTQEDHDNKGALLPAVESSGRGRGRLVEYSVTGQQIAVWDDRGVLNGPWAVVAAPANFGPFSNQLIVGNFSDGTLVGFNTTTKRATEYMRDTKGNVIKIQGLWNILFGNGQSLGDSNALYFSAGPADETDGLFGSLRFAG